MRRFVYTDLLTGEEILFVDYHRAKKNEAPCRVCSNRIGADRCKITNKKICQNFTCNYHPIPKTEK
jgi:hypothetical protein